MVRIIYLFLFFSAYSYAQNWSAEKQQFEARNATLKKSILTKTQEISKLKKELLSLDQDLVNKEKQISVFDENAKKQSEIIEKLKEDFLPLKKEISSVEADLKKVLKKYYLNNLDEEPTIAQMAEKKQLQSFIETMAIDLKLRKQEFEKLEAQMKDEEVKLQDLYQTKATLISLIEEVKLKKDNLSQTIQEKQKQPKPTITPVPTVAEIKKEIAKKTTSSGGYLFEIEKPTKESESNKKFDLPLKDFISVNVEGKGIALVYQNVCPIYAPDNAKVVFTGELASYGNVIMLDHGSDIRTVLLGNLNAKIRKYDEVKRGDLIGYAEFETGKKNQLYFEVRKKDFVLNTSQYLNKSLLKSRN